ncbi:DNA topoisomerase IB [Agromyces sp. H3Y2-19a]|jgi:DNA topoisomerase IB|uniref:DNA topoisomerase IB n=1 Tax=Agromyces TaxID=33877 RepID=UPI001E4F4D13|nr:MULTISPECIES: DNA topoisomerase IB [Agromyces]MCD5345075.1 DNA topoisomerase IB [Agromyces sp. S2-1-8]MDF0513767.1 DNA topoisomerase IB [Agromyces chromiiresistens]
MPRLKRVEPYVSPGYTRVRRGRGFSYVHTDGGAAGRAERARIADLAVPPAWNEVWIADAANAHILAVGVDAAGRRQYLYHPAWRERQDAEKFQRMAELARVLPTARRSARGDLATEGMPRARVLAAAFTTLDLGGIRIGSEESLAGFRNRGLTTLLVRNAALETAETVRFRFRAKGGIAQELRVADAGLARFVGEAGERSAAARLYAWADGRTMRAASPSDVNDDIRARTGGEFTAKDFRTLRGTLVAAEHLAALGPATSARARAASVRDAIEEASRALGNTPAIARASYVDPRIVEAYERGAVVASGRDRERRLLDLLDGSAFAG